MRSGPAINIVMIYLLILVILLLIYGMILAGEGTDHD
jgi:hypothetical protein